METSIIVFLIAIIILLGWLLFEAYKRQDESFVLINKGQKNFKKLMEEVEKIKDLAGKSQDNFIEMMKLINKETTNFYKQGGDWANEAEQAGLIYYIIKHRDQTEILIGLKGWDLAKCNEQGNVFSIPSFNPKEIMESLSGMLIRDAMDGYQRNLSSPLKVSKGKN